MSKMTALLTTILTLILALCGNTAGTSDVEAYAAATSLWQNADYEKAVSSYKQMISSAPNAVFAAQAHIQLGVYLKYNGRFNEAILEYEKAVRKAPGTRTAHDAKTSIMAVRYLQGRYDDATKICQEVLKESSDWDQVKYCAYWIRELRRLKGTRRLRMSDCGIRSLVEMCRMCGIQSSNLELERILMPDSDGVSAGALVDAAQSQGLQLVGLRLDNEGLLKLPKPAIALVRSDHYVVVTAADGEVVRLIDPLDGASSISLKDFADMWDGYAIVPRKGLPDALISSALPRAELDKLRGAVCYCCPPGQLGGPGENPGVHYDGPQGSPCLGNPVYSVNMGSLNLLIQDLDLTYPTIGPAVAILRTYNADSPTESAFGRGWTFNYNMSATENPGGSVDIRMETGRIARFTLDSQGHYVAPTGLFDTLTRRGDGGFDLLRRPSHEVFRFAPPPLGKLTNIVDANGNTLTLSYNGSMLTSVTDSVGRVTTVSYGGNGKIETITDPAGRQVQYEYDGLGNLTATTDLAGFTSRFTYNSASYIISMTTPKGTTLFGYSSSSEGAGIQWVTDPGNRTRHYGGEFTTTVTDEDGGQESWTNDSTNRATRSVNPTGASMQYGYDAVGNTNLVVRPDGYRFTATYDSHGNITSMQDALGGTTSFTYDGADNLLTMTDSVGRAISFTYDANRNLTRITDPIGRHTEFEYGAGGLLTSLVNQAGNRTVFEYDTFSYPAAVTDALGNRTEFRYDCTGNRMATVDPLGRTTSYAYDALNRLVQLVHPDGSSRSLSYACCWLSSVADENKSTKTFDYDYKGRLLSVTDGLGTCASYSYLPGRVVRVMDGKGNTTEMTYDPARRLQSVRYADGTLECYSYDSVGNLVSKTNGKGLTTRFTYRADGKLTRVSAPGLGTSYTYDVSGNLRLMKDATGVSRFWYDQLGRVTRIVDSLGRTVAYGYDQAGNRSYMSTPSGMVWYGYDALGRLTSLRNKWYNGHFSYDEAGNCISSRDGLKRSFYAYDLRNRLVSINHLNNLGQVTARYQYLLDPVGNPTAVTQGDGSRTFYAYDERERLVMERRVGGSSRYGYSYAYDAADNRISKTDLSLDRTVSYTYDAGNKLLRAGESVYSYDQNGNAVACSSILGTTIYQWDALDRLISVGIPGYGNLQYAYDGFGQRLSRRVPGTTTTFLFDDLAAAPAVIAEGSSPGITYALTPAGMAVAQQSGSHAYSYAEDGLASIGHMTGPLEVKTVYDGDAFGNAIGVGDPGPRGYVGRYGYWLDPESQLLLLGARWYDPGIGRFLSRDPIRSATGNLYSYAGNKPTSAVDPSGMITTDSWLYRYTNWVDPITDFRVSTDTWWYQHTNWVDPIVNEFQLSTSTCWYKYTNWVDPAASAIERFKDYRDPWTRNEGSGWDLTKKLGAQALWTIPGIYGSLFDYGTDLAKDVPNALNDPEQLGKDSAKALFGLIPGSDMFITVFLWNTPHAGDGPTGGW